MGKLIMYAMLIKNGDFVRAQVPDPVRKENEVIIDIEAAALNRADLLQRTGNYPPPPGWPEWPGLEVSGTVIEVSAGSRWNIGDKVCALLGGGGYAEKVAVPHDMVLPVPQGISMIEAAGIPEVFATAYLNLHIEAGMKSGDTVFIQAGASGLGLAAIQFTKMRGAKVITTVGSDDKAEFVRKFGADIVVNRKTDNLLEALQNNPPDITLDCVAGPALGKCLETMAPGGRWIVIASLGGELTEIDMNKFFKRGIRLIGSTLRSRTSAMKAQILAAMEKEFWPAFTAQTLKPVIYKTLPIAEVEAAHAILQRNENTGKVILSLK